MGLQAARTYARIAPASSHARHMPSHVFLPLGMWDEAAASDESSFAASVDRVKRLGLSMAQADFHSLSWLHYEYLQQGRFAKAREVEETVRKALAPAPGPAEAGHYRSLFRRFAVVSGISGPRDRGSRRKIPRNTRDFGVFLGSRTVVPVVSGFSRTV